MTAVTIPASVRRTMNRMPPIKGLRKIGETHFVSAELDLSLIEKPPYSEQRKFRVFNEKGLKCTHCQNQASRLLLAGRKDAPKSLVADLYTRDGILLTVEPIVPLEEGGRNEVSNLQPVCEYCKLVREGKLIATPVAPTPAASVLATPNPATEVTYSAAPQQQRPPVSLAPGLGDEWILRTSKAQKMSRFLFYRDLHKKLDIFKAENRESILAEYKQEYPVGARVIWREEDNVQHGGTVTQAPFAYADTAINRKLGRMIRMEIQDASTGKLRMLNLSVRPMNLDFHTNHAPKVSAAPVYTRRGDAVVEEYPATEVFERGSGTRYLRLKEVFQEKGFNCVSCGIEATRYVHYRIKGNASPANYGYGLFSDNYTMFTLDHIIPLHLSGPDIVENLQPMCEDCNSKKGHRLPARETIPPFLLTHYENAIKTELNFRGPGKFGPDIQLAMDLFEISKQVEETARQAYEEAQAKTREMFSNYTTLMRQKYPVGKRLTWFLENTGMYQKLTGTIDSIVIGARNSIEPVKLRVLSDSHKVKHNVPLSTFPTLSADWEVQELMRKNEVEVSS